MEFDDFENGDVYAKICELIGRLETRVRTVFRDESPGDIALFLTQIIEMCCEGVRGEELPQERQLELLQMHLDPYEVPDSALREFFRSTVCSRSAHQITTSVPVDLVAKTMRRALEAVDQEPYFVEVSTYRDGRDFGK